MALGPYETALGWLGSENRKSSIRVFFDYNQLCTSKLDLSKGTFGSLSSLFVKHDCENHVELGAPPPGRGPEPSIEVGLRQLTLRALKAQARSLGADKQQVDAVDDTDDPKQAAIALVLAMGG